MCEGYEWFGGLCLWNFFHLMHLAFLGKVRIPYFTLIFLGDANVSEMQMLAKMTSKNQLTLPKALIAQVGATEYFDVEARNGQLVLTPVRIQRGDGVRAKLTALKLKESDIADAVTWARKRK